MQAHVPGRQLRIYIGESDQWQSQPLYTAIVQEARRRGLAGATMARGIIGFGARSAIHQTHLLRLSSDLPVVIEIVDTDEKIVAFLPCLGEMVHEGMMTTSQVEIIAYKAGP